MSSSSATSQSTPAPRRGRPRKSAAERDENERRVELVREAARLFRSQGFAATTTREIAAAAGMQSGSPFYYFKSKNAMLQAVMEDGMAQAIQSQAQALAALAPDVSPRERLRVLVRHHFDVLLGPASDFIPVMLYEWHALAPEQRQAITARKDAYEAAWVPVLTDLHASGQLKGQPAVARLFIFGALNWSVQWFDERRGLSIDELAQQALMLFVGQEQSD